MTRIGKTGAGAMLALGIITAASLAAAQSNNIAPSATDRTFVQQAAMSDLFEIEAGKLALSRAREAPIKQLAQSITADHTQAAAQLKDTAAVANLGVALPTNLDAAHARMLSQLRAASDQRFDAVFLIVQAETQKRALKLHEDYQQQSTSPTLKALAESGAESAKAHLSKIREIATANAR
jgi:putative membrane protein